MVKEKELLLIDGSSFLYLEFLIYQIYIRLKKSMCFV